MSLSKVRVGHQPAKPRERVLGGDNGADRCKNSRQGASEGGIASALVDRFTRDILKLISSGALDGARSVAFLNRASVQPPGPEATVIDEAGTERTGVNCASYDYLGLSTHAAVRAASIEAINHYGKQTAGAPVLQGNSPLSLRLQDAVAAMLGLPHVVLFPTGWAAGYGVIAGLIRAKDHVILDQYAHNCCVPGAMAATRNVHRVRHLSTDAFLRQLRRIRATDTENAILVVTEGIFSMDGDSPDLPALQAACREYEATLLIDVAHDLGAVGPGGTGSVGLQGLVGQVDVVIGRLSKALATEMWALDDDLSTLAQTDPRRAQGSDVMAVVCGVAGQTCRRVTDQGRYL